MKIVIEYYTQQPKAPVIYRLNFDKEFESFLEELKRLNDLKAKYTVSRVNSTCLGDFS